MDGHEYHCMFRRKHLKASGIVTGKLDIQNLILTSGCFTFKTNYLFLYIVQASGGNSFCF